MYITYIHMQMIRSYRRFTNPKILSKHTVSRTNLNEIEIRLTFVKLFQLPPAVTQLNERCFQILFGKWRLTTEIWAGSAGECAANYNRNFLILSKNCDILFLSSYLAKMLFKYVKPFRK